MMHRLLSGCINDASIIWPSHQRCIDYLALASMMHRLCPARINDASIIDASMMHQNGSIQIMMHKKESIQIMMHQKESIQIMMHQNGSIKVVMHENGSIFLQLMGFDHTLGPSCKIWYFPLASPRPGCPFPTGKPQPITMKPQILARVSETPSQGKYSKICP